MAFWPGTTRVFWSSALMVLLVACATNQPSKSLQPIAMPTVRPAPPHDESGANRKVLAEALQYMAQNNPTAALNAIAAVRDPAERVKIGAEFMAALADRSPAVAAALVPTWQLGRSRAADIELVATKFARADAEAALRWAAALSEPTTASDARRAVATALLASDPRAALERISALPDGEAKEMLAGFAVAAWARRQPADAEAWVRGLADGERKQRLLSSVAFEEAQTDPKRALELAQSLPSGRDRRLLLAASSETWMAQDPRAALAWANQLPPGEERDAALTGVNAAFGEGRAVRVAAASDVRVATGRAALAGGGAVMPTDGYDFALWRTMHPQYASAEEAAAEYVRQRANVEPLAVGQWIANLPGGATRERVIDTYLETSAPGTAALWLTSLAGTDQTNERIERVAGEWLQTNPTAATAWLNGTTLPVYRKEYLLRKAGL